MRGQGWLGSKAMRNLRRRMLPETHSLFSSEFFSGRIYQRISTATLRMQSDYFLGGLVSRSFGAARWNRSSACCTGTTRNRFPIHCW